ncbi:MAG: glucans biosynthesis glucosyltransferase MdoH [Sulfitobacter sp.]
MTDSASHLGPRHMPAPAPLAMQVQNLRACPAPRRAPLRPAGTQQRSALWRMATFLPALLGTGFLIYGMYGWLSGKGMSALEWILLIMIGMTFVWVSLSVSTVGVAVAGLLARTRADAGLRGPVAPLNVALLIPVYNESPADVFGNAAAMLDDLRRRRGAHHYTLFVLSDSRDEDIAAQEWQAFEQLRASAPAGMDVHYRRRATNTDKKVGNLVDWITGWGAAYEAMVVLDADSLMTGRAIDRMASEMSADPDAGLIQTFPMLIGARSVFARLQQFSNIAYGWLLAEGLALWARSEGNYWGHNAIIRTAAFASCAGLPHLRGRRGEEQLILSHDFVEAGLLRRAGWQVRFLPRVSGSFEETPATLIDYVLRDRRWCRGNLQHLRLLHTAGLHPVSRFHMLHGAVAYLLSPAWFVLLVFWSLLGKDADTNVVRYFSEANPFFPDWPPAMSHIDSAVFLIIMYAMLLTPKLAAAGILMTQRAAMAGFGGRMAFTASFVTEVVLSIAYAPILMIQQSKAVLRSLSGRAEPWAPQRRDGKPYPLRTLLAFHWVETLLGLLLLTGLAAGLLSWWLIPIVASLVLAVPLSALSSVELPQNGWQLSSPHSLRVPAIARQAERARAALRRELGKPRGLAAE